ncbi:MAG: NUDIX hydrolase [Tetrasphaera sp.]
MSLADEVDPQPVLASETVYHGLVWDVRRDLVDLGVAGHVQRDLVEHPGAVAVLALDEQDRIALVQQYRHPVGVREWEIPAGLLDLDGEDPLVTAARELAEEADLAAESWAVLLDYVTSPGFTDEAIRIYVARGLSEIPPAERHTRSGEEHGMSLCFVPLDEALEAVLSGRLHNPHTVIAILSAQAFRSRGWAGLRPADSAWPQWERLHRPAPRSAPPERGGDHGIQRQE